MKANPIYLLLLLISVSSCTVSNYNRSFTSSYDEFSEAKQTYFNRTFNTREVMRCHGCRGCYDVDFRFTHSENLSPDSAITVQIFIKDPDEYAPNLTKDAQIKVDDQIYDVDLFNIRGNLDNNPSIDSTGVIISNRVSKTHIAEFIMSEEMMSRLRRSQKVSYRFYAGGRYPFTVELQEFRLGELKRFSYMAIRNE